jgi:hypothetical protein
MNEQTLGARVGNALSAAGITLAPIIDRPIEVFSSDPLDGHEVRVSLTPEGSASWEPDGAVVLAGCGCDGPAFQGCCQATNFFSSRANAEQYLSEQSGVRGFPISMPEAIACGRAIFGDLLADA